MAGAPGATIRVFVTHLGSRADSRLAQALAIRAAITDGAEQSIVTRGGLWIDDVQAVAIHALVGGAVVVVIACRIRKANASVLVFVAPVFWGAFAGNRLAYTR